MVGGTRHLGCWKRYPPRYAKHVEVLILTRHITLVLREPIRSGVFNMYSCTRYSLVISPPQNYNNFPIVPSIRFLLFDNSFSPRARMCATKDLALFSLTNTAVSSSFFKRTALFV